MFVQVKLLQGYQKTLTYKIPDCWENKNLDGSVITVPLKNKIVPALVTKILFHPPLDINFEIKEAVGRDHLPPDELYPKFVTKISQFYFAPKKLFYQRIRKFVHTKTQSSSNSVKSPDISSQKSKTIKLTPEQQNVVDYMLPLIKRPKYSPTLLYGVTGSGKTEVYKKIITECIKHNKSVLLLLPEVSLSLQFENLLAKQLNCPIFSFHSATKAKEKKILWSRLLEQKPTLIIGVHLPTLLPIPNLGCIIVDEEHEQGFAEKKHPKINSKEVALWRAKFYDIPILLGSATPSLSSLYSVEKHNFKLFRLTKRFSGNFPKIKTVKIESNKRNSRQSFWITKELELAISDRLAKKEQTIIYLNRRGYSFFVQCKQCSHTFLCPNCSVSLTLHRSHDGTQLKCHYCDHTQPNPTVCPECKAPEKELLKRGVGTQQIVTILSKIFPAAKIARADMDTTKKKRLWGETLEQFEQGEIDILVGTQTITKGYHFPNITLVGIIWADLNVHFPVFNASERALQQLIQVAGRAGRQSNKEGLVIAQIMHDHPIFSHLNEENYLNFCKEEMEFRKETLYPPYGRFVQIELKHTNGHVIEQESQKLFELLSQADPKNTTSILGPTRPLVYRIQKTEIRHIFLKAENFAKIYTLLKSIDKNEFSSKIFIVPT